MLLFSKKIVPCDFIAPEIALRVEDFPAPFEPIMVTILATGICRVRFFTA